MLTVRDRAIFVLSFGIPRIVFMSDVVGRGVDDCEPCGTAVDETSSYGVVDRVPSGTLTGSDANDFCECVAVGNVIGEFTWHFNLPL